MSIQPVVEVNDLSYFRDGGWALEGIALRVEAGEFLGIIGPNGGGKSTLLKLMAGLLEPHKGSVKIDGRPPAQSGRLMGYVPQETGFNLSFPIRAIDVVRMGFLGQKHPGGKEGEKAAALEALGRVGANHLINRRIGELSGGERQRVFIARALVGGVRLLLLDEPTASIDPKGQRDIYELLLSLLPDITVVLVSHDITQLVGYATSVASINRRLLHYEKLPKGRGHEGHICEVELLEAFLARQKNG